MQNSDQEKFTNLLSESRADKLARLISELTEIASGLKSITTNLIEIGELSLADMELLANPMTDVDGSVKLIKTIFMNNTPKAMAKYLKDNS